MIGKNQMQPKIEGDSVLQQVFTYLLLCKNGKLF